MNFVSRIQGKCSDGEAHHHLASFSPAAPSAFPECDVSMYRLFQLCHTDIQEYVRGLVFLLLLLFLLMLLFKRNNYLMYMCVCVHVIPGACKVQKRVSDLWSRPYR